MGTALNERAIGCQKLVRAHVEGVTGVRTPVFIGEDPLPATHEETAQGPIACADIECACAAVWHVNETAQRDARTCAHMASRGLSVGS